MKRCMDVEFLLILKKAFGTVDHDIMIHSQKLEHYGVCNVALSSFKSYVTDNILIGWTQRPKILLVVYLGGLK